MGSWPPASSSSSSCQQRSGLASDGNVALWGNSEDIAEPKRWLRPRRKESVCFKKKKKRRTRKKTIRVLNFLEVSSSVVLLKMWFTDQCLSETCSYWSTNWEWTLWNLCGNLKFRDIQAGDRWIWLMNPHVDLFGHHWTHVQRCPWSRPRRAICPGTTYRPTNSWTCENWPFSSGSLKTTGLELCLSALVSPPCPHIWGHKAGLWKISSGTFRTSRKTVNIIKITGLHTLKGTPSPSPTFTPKLMIRISNLPTEHWRSHKCLRTPHTQDWGQAPGRSPTPPSFISKGSQWSNLPYLKSHPILRLDFNSFILKKVKERKWSRSVVSDSLQSHGLQPTRLLHPGDSPGKNTGVGCHFLLQGIFPTQGLNPGLPHCRQTL